MFVDLRTVVSVLAMESIQRGTSVSMLRCGSWILTSVKCDRLGNELKAYPARFSRLVLVDRLKRIGLSGSFARLSISPLDLYIITCGNNDGRLNRVGYSNHRALIHLDAGQFCVGP